MFLNTSIRRLQLKNVTPKCPVIGVEAVFIGECREFVGENDGEVTLGGELKPAVHCILNYTRL